MGKCFAGAQLALVAQASRSGGLFRTLEPIDGFFDAIRGLRAAGIHVRVCTSPDL